MTYFPEQLMAQKLKESGYGNELTKLKQVCRNLEILIPKDLKDKELKIHLYNRVSEDCREIAINFISDLRSRKLDIIEYSELNPQELKVWLYENQGEGRFDASNRFFLVLTDEGDGFNSWKLKRNIVFLKEKINEHLDNIILDSNRLNTSFYWWKTEQTYNCKSDILFLKQRL